MKTARLTPIIAFSIVLLSTVAPVLAGIVKWTSSGPIVPTIPTAFATDPSTSGTIYVGTDGGLFKSTNGGTSFSALNWSTVNSISAIAVGSAPGVLYVGIEKSTDGGQSWNPISRPPSDDNVQEILVDRKNPGTLYALVASSGGAFKSTDDGATWTLLSAGGTTPQGPAHILSLMIDPTNSSILYATTDTSDVYGYRNGSPFTDCPSRGFRSTDGGATWVDATGITDPLIWLYCGGGGPWAVDPFDHNNLLAVSDIFPETTYNAGQTWSPLHLAGPGAGAIYSATGIFWDPLSAGVVYVTTSTGVYASTDGGTTWYPTGAAPASASFGNSLAFDSSTAGTIYCFGIGTLLKTTDGGESWSAITTPSTTVEVRSVAIDPFDAPTAYADAYKTTDGGASWTPVNVGSPIVFDPVIPGTLYAGGHAGNNATILKSLDGGATWAPQGFSATGGVTSIAIDPTAPSVLYAALAFPQWASTSFSLVYKSTDAGATWRPASTGLPAVSSAGDEINGPWMSIDPLSPSTLYVSFNSDHLGNNVFKSVDGGASWKPLATGVPPGTDAVEQIVCDPATSGMVWLSTHGGLLQSLDGGVHWANLGFGDSGTHIAIAAGAKKTVFGTSSSGVSLTTDNGGHWATMNAGFSAPPPFISDLAVSSDGSTLYAATSSGAYSYTIGPACTPPGRCITPVHSPPVAPIHGRNH